MEIEKNTVSAVRQVKDEHVVVVVDKGADLNVLFIGNSITRHAPKPEIGWEGNWGMAASAEEFDYVHIIVAMQVNMPSRKDLCAENAVHYTADVHGRSEERRKSCGVV